MGGTTHFASAYRSLPGDLERDIRLAVGNPVTTEIMRLAGGMVVVINENRQIVAANKGFQRFLGVDDAGSLLGLRPGEAMQCVYADSMDSGCGTSLQCASCDAIGAVLEAHKKNDIVERRSAVQVKTDDGTADMCVWVRVCPIQYEGRPFFIVFLSDITEEERKCELERVFHHDALNTALAISSACRLIERHYGEGEDAMRYARFARTLSGRLMKDLRVHDLLSEAEDSGFSPDLEQIDIGEFMNELKDISETWPAAQDVKIELTDIPSGLAVKTDPYLLYRVMTNMLLNACEASADEGVVRLWAEQSGENTVLKVWSKAHIPEHIAPRIFQRHFSTKGGRGRGVGTYSMKLIGERLLGGTVSFDSSREEGTVFSVTLG